MGGTPRYGHARTALDVEKLPPTGSCFAQTQAAGPPSQDVKSMALSSQSPRPTGGGSARAGMSGSPDMHDAAKATRPGSADKFSPWIGGPGTRYLRRDHSGSRRVLEQIARLRRECLSVLMLAPLSHGSFAARQVMPTCSDAGGGESRDCRMFQPDLLEGHRADHGVEHGLGLRCDAPVLLGASVFLSPPSERARKSGGTFELRAACGFARPCPRLERCRASR